MKLTRDEIEIVVELIEMAYNEDLLNENGVHLLKLIWECCPDIQKRQTWMKI